MKKPTAAEQVEDKYKNLQLGCTQTSQCYHEKARGMLIRKPNTILKKVNQSRYRPEVAQRVPGSKGSQIT